MDELAAKLTEFVNLLQQWGVLRQVINTAWLVAVFIFLRLTAVRLIGRWNVQKPEDKRRWIVQLKNLSLFILVVGMFAIWLSELRAVAISLVAVSAAVVLTAKELILCAFGGVYKASVRPFELGDRIEINGVRGEVIDHSLIGTTLMEIGPFKEANQHSGRQVVIPNSWFLEHPIFNQSIQQDYILHNMRIPLGPNDDWKKAEEVLLHAANQECAGYLEPARWSMVRLGQIQGLDLPRVEPRVHFQIQDGGFVNAILRVPALASKTSKTEQAIIRQYLEKCKSPNGPQA